MNESNPVPLCRPGHSQLLVVDVQERLAGAMPDAELEPVLRNLGVLLQAADRLEIPVTATEQYPRGLGPTVPAVAASLPAASGRFEKTGFSCCLAEGFSEALAAAARPQVVLAGMEAHVCVLQTAIDLTSRGFEVYVVEDAVCSRNSRHRDNALARLRQAGVWVTNTESVLFEWLRDSSHPQFKAVSKLIR
jgi:nicotinamidase-related amidase